MILTWSNVKVKVTGLLNFRKLAKPCMLAAMTVSPLAGLSGFISVMVTCGRLSWLPVNFSVNILWYRAVYCTGIVCGNFGERTDHETVYLLTFAPTEYWHLQERTENILIRKSHQLNLHADFDSLIVHLSPRDDTHKAHMYREACAVVRYLSVCPSVILQKQLLEKYLLNCQIEMPSSNMHPLDVIS